MTGEARADLPEFRPPGAGVSLDRDELVEASPAVADGTAPVLRIRVTEDGWQFLAGEFPPGEELVRLPRRQVYAHEKGLAVLEEFLHAGYGAVRVGSQEPWGLGPLVLQDEPVPAEPVPPRVPGHGPAATRADVPADGPNRRGPGRWWRRRWWRGR